MRGGGVPEVAPEPAPPRLARAALRVTDAPPSMESAIEILAEARDRREFGKLVLQFLPGESEEILAGGNAAEVTGRFAEAFSERYFPLHHTTIWGNSDMEWDGGESAYSRFRWGIPLMPEGIDEEEWHEVWETCGRGMGAIALLLEVPHDPGVRTAWLEEAARHIPLSTLQRIPQGGIPIERIERALRGTHLECAANALQWFYQESGNFFIDVPPDLYYESVPASWESETVAALAAEWQLARPILEASIHAQIWMEADLPARFAELLDLVLERMGQESMGPEKEDGGGTCNQEKKEKL